jgi:hypothetical protein
MQTVLFIYLFGYFPSGIVAITAVITAKMKNVWNGHTSADAVREADAVVAQQCRTLEWGQVVDG